MSEVEPNVAALLCFALLAVVGSIGFYILVGVFPLETRPDLRHRNVASSLIVADVLLLIAIISGSLAYAASNLRWTSIVIVSGLAALFAPGLFNVWPQRWRDGTTGLLTVLTGLVAALALLHHLGAFSFHQINLG